MSGCHGSAVKPRVLFILSGPIFEVRQRHFEELSRTFSGCIFTSSQIAEIRAVRAVGDFSFHCIGYIYRFKTWSNLSLLLHALAFCLRCRLRHERYDLVATYDPLKTGLIGMLCSSILRARFAPEVNGVYTSPAEYLDGRGTFSTRIRSLVYPRLERLVLKNADGAKTLFPCQLEPFSDILQGKVIRCFPNNVAIDRFLALDEDADSTEVLFVGFPFWRKGVDILIAAFKEVAAEFPAWRLNILGWLNPAELQDAIGGHPQIRHTPAVLPRDMPGEIGRCAILVLPSRSEAMGRVLVEAMAAGKPRIGANIDGIPTVIADGIDGLLFAAEDVSDLATKLRMLMADSQLRESLGRAARLRARREFSSARYFANISDYYTAIIQSAGRDDRSR